MLQAPTLPDKHYDRGGKNSSPPPPINKAMNTVKMLRAWNLKSKKKIKYCDSKIAKKKNPGWGETNFWRNLGKDKKKKPKELDFQFFFLVRGCKLKK